ncbi:hypothetical protein M9H77_12706 [Catharanthus roseus]|uniref:Uncharacterized protein n=1 Tax=Catharanthus roseus TaxID=4058 RepID=A0ACC0BIC2_CATRO|nr:hypothetical protein M9H77_12706 [Catharanthus roseus]
MVGAPGYVTQFYVNGECGSGHCPWSRTIALYVLLNSGVEATLMCLDSLRLPSYVRTPHVGFALVFGTCSLVSRGTQIPYSAAVNLVEGLGASQMVSEAIVPERDLIPVIDLPDDETMEGPVAQGIELIGVDRKGS